MVYKWQYPSAALKVFSDADWAGDARSAKSASGGVLLRGGHVIHHWSRTQANIALSSGEAELNAGAKATSEALHLKQLGSEVGFSMSVNLLGDSSASKGILLRKGCGKVKHLTVKQLWVQAYVSDGTVQAHQDSEV